MEESEEIEAVEEVERDNNGVPISRQDAPPVQELTMNEVSLLFSQ